MIDVTPDFVEAHKKLLLENDLSGWKAVSAKHGKMPVDVSMFVAIAMWTFARSQKTMAKLEARVADLEAHPPLHYEGVHVPGKSYPVGACVTSAGSLWYCKTPTCEPPGQSGDWVLCCKRGKDGKDGRDLR